MKAHFPAGLFAAAVFFLFLVRGFSQTVDTVPPTVACINGLAINQLNIPVGAGQAPSVTLWATDFVQYADDNLTAPFELDFALRDPDVNPGTGFPLDQNGLPRYSLQWPCTEIGTNIVELWARDEAGNASVCPTYLVLSDPYLCCLPSSPSYLAAACVTGPNCAGGIPDVKMFIYGSNPAFPNPSPASTSGPDGCFPFVTGLPIGTNYTVSLQKDINPLNGVSTFDLVRISKHVLNVQPFTAAWQHLAADINRNNQVTTFDIVELRKLILGIYSDFPQNESWRFIQKGQLTFTPGVNPLSPAIDWPCTLSVSAPCEFEGIKIGDLTGDALCNNFAPEPPVSDRSPARIFVEDRFLKKGETADLPLFLEKEADLAAWQLALRFDPDLIKIELPETDGQNETLPEGPDGRGAKPLAALTAPGRVAANWFSAAPRRFFGGQSELISLKINALQDCRLSDVFFLEKENLKPAVFFEDGSERPVELIFSEKREATAEASLSIWPNPFSEKTTVEWRQAEAGDALVEVFDATGRAVFSARVLGQKGANRFELTGLPTGLLFVKTATGGMVLTAKIEGM